MSASRGDQAELIQIPVVCDFSDDGAEDDSPVEADRTPPPQRCPADAICDSTVDAPGDVALSSSGGDHRAEAQRVGRARAMSGDTVVAMALRLSNTSPSPDARDSPDSGGSQPRARGKRVSALKATYRGASRIEGFDNFIERLLREREQQSAASRESCRGASGWGSFLAESAAGRSARDAGRAPSTPPARRADVVCGAACEPIVGAAPGEVARIVKQLTDAGLDAKRDFLISWARARARHDGVADREGASDFLETLGVELDAASADAGARTACGEWRAVLDQLDAELGRPRHSSAAAEAEPTREPGEVVHRAPPRPSRSSSEPPRLASPRREPRASIAVVRDFHPEAHRCALPRIVWDAAFANSGLWEASDAEDSDSDMSEEEPPTKPPRPAPRRPPPPPPR